MCHAFSQYRKYLHSYYNRNPIVRDDKLSIAPCSQFINLALVKEDEQINSRAFTKSTLHDGVDEIKKSKIPVGMDAIVTSDSKFVLVEGPPGIGKSTLCWELCRQWDTLKSLKDYKIVLQLKLRERRVQIASSLQEIFYNRDNELSQNVVKEVCRCEGEGVLLIFDGFDEMPTSIVQDKDSLLMELISGTSLPRATRLVTSRPSALHHKEKCFPQEYRHIEILGFITDESKVRYAELAFKSEPEVFASFKSFIFSNPIIKSLMYIPVNCAIIARVYKDIRKSRKLMPKTMTQLYSTLIPVLIKRYMIEKGEWDSDHGIPSNLDDLPNEFVFALNRVSELAYNGLFKESIQLVFTDSDVGEGFQHLGLLSETKEMYVCEGAVSSYSFLHLSIQEFLAAWHVKCHPELICAILTKYFVKNLFGKYLIIPKFTTFAYFLAGMIGCDEVFNFYSDLSFLIMCMYEAQDCSKLSSQNPHVYDIQSNPMEMYAFGYVLVHAPAQWILNINANLLPPFDILMSSLLDHKSFEHQKIQGSIQEIELLLLFNMAYSRLQQLLPPKCLLHSITACKFTGCFTASMVHHLLPGLVNLQKISVKFNKDHYQGDHLLYELLGDFRINDLQLMFTHISKNGLQKLSTTFFSNCTLEKVKLIYRDPPFDVDSSPDLSQLVESALSCSSIKSLETNIPFFILPTQHHLQNLTFIISAYFMSSYPHPLFDCLFCIAAMCRVQTMKSLKITNNCLPLSLPDHHNSTFMSVLNNSLHHNPSLSLSLQNNHLGLEELPHITRKVYLNVRRTKSLSDIASLISVDIDTLRSFALISDIGLFAEDNDYGPYRHSLQRTMSCWDFQSLHNIHPLLKEILFY